MIDLGSYRQSDVLALPEAFHYSGDIQRKTRGVLFSTKAHKALGLSFIELGTEYDQINTEESSLSESSIDEALREARHIEETVFFGGYFFGHFGHFIHESLTRLWPFATCEELRGRKPPIYYFSQWKKLELSDHSLYASQILAGFSINPENCINIDLPILFKSIIVPPQLGGLGCNHDSQSERHSIDSLKIVRTFYQSFSPNRIMSSDISDNKADNRRVYVSRSSLSNAGGRYLFETSIENFLADNDFEIYDPASECLTNQIEKYLESDHIIFAEGSALYALLFIPGSVLATKRISVILRRKNGKWLSDYLENLNIGLSIVQINKIAIDGLFGPNPWDSFSILNMRGVAESICEIHKIPKVNAKISITPEDDFLATLVLNADKDSLSRDIALILESISFGSATS